MRFYWLYNPKVEVSLESVLTQVSDGWHDMLTKGFEQMFELGWDGNIAQIKEKFGGLRLYGGFTDEQEDIVIRMEEESLTICADCGEQAKMQSKGWVMYFCDKHAPEGSHRL